MNTAFYSICINSNIFCFIQFGYQSEGSLKNSAQKQQGQKATRIKDTVWFVYTNKYHKLFTELQSFETGEEHRGKSRICLFIINYVYGMFYSVRYAERHDPEEQCLIKMLYYINSSKTFSIAISVQITNGM